MLPIQTLAFSFVPKVWNKLLTPEEVHFKQFQALYYFLLFFKLPSYKSNILQNSILRLLNVVLILDSFDFVIELILILLIILKFIMKVAGRSGEALYLCSEVPGSNI
jgi:hypothetical protein